jgi:hypothetical protein
VPTGIGDPEPGAKYPTFAAKEKRGKGGVALSRDFDMMQDLHNTILQIGIFNVI